MRVREYCGIPYFIADGPPRLVLGIDEMTDTDREQPQVVGDSQVDTSYTGQIATLRATLAQMTAENHRLKAEAASSTAPSTSPDAVSNRVAPSGSDSEQLEAYVVRELSPHLTMQALAQQLAQMTAERDGLKEMLHLQMSLKDDYLKAADKWSERTELAEAHVVRLQRALETYGQHKKRECTLTMEQEQDNARHREQGLLPLHHPKCTCGFTATEVAHSDGPPTTPSNEKT